MDRDSPSVTSPADSVGHGDASVKTKKRKRVAAACDECRAKKTKCDGSQPICSPCTKRNGQSATCTWGDRKSRSRGASKDELARLQRRVNELQNELETGRRNFQEHNGEQTPIPPSASIHIPEECGETTHANAMMGLMEEEHQNYLNQFGDSSATGFMNQIKRVIDQQVTPPDSHQSSLPVPGSGRQFIRKTSSLQQQANLDYVLPSRIRADRLLETYWRLVDTLYPFLDKNEVVATYGRLWTGESLGNEGQTFLCLLNVIFALSCILDPSISPKERVGSAEVFYQRAREQLDFELIQRQSILTVQCLLVLGQYLQSTTDPQQCWIFVGMAIRVAQSLGLDLPSTSAQAQSERQRDLLRRVWYGCVLLDRALSMTFGRPAMIQSQAATTVPRPIVRLDSSERAYSPGNSVAGLPSSDLHFFIESLKLYELMNEILLSIYNPVSSEEVNDDLYVVYFGSLGATAVGKVFEMDKKFWLWSHDLPAHLQFHTTTKKSLIHERQTNVLWLRYRHVRILLFRPILSQFCSKNDNSETSLEDAMSPKIALQCSVMCVKIALETIEFFDSRVEGRKQEELDDLLPAWWYSIFYIYTAATVLIAARLHPALIAQVTNEAILNAWHAVLKVLKRFQSFGNHAKRCTAALEVLFDQVPQQHRHKQARLQHQSRQHQSRQQQERVRTLHEETDSTTAANGRLSQAPHAPQLEYTVATNCLASPEVHSSNGYNYSQPYPMASELWIPQEYSSNTGVFETGDLQLDFGDMSWLNSIPHELYSH